VRADWELVEAVAEELLERETLSGDEVEDVVRARRRP
jgi:ATP-dependent Zn protease